MSSSKSQIRSPYHLRSRSKVVRPLSPASAKKNPETDSAGYDTSQTEDVGGQFVPLNDEEIEKFLYETFDAKGVIYTPPVPLSEEEEHRMYNDFNNELAQIGLSYLNDDSAKTGPKYELVSPVGGGCFLSDNCIVYHFNFEAKLVNKSGAKAAQLFFLEIVQTSPGQEKVTQCCSLGLSGSKAALTGLNGCTVCEEDVNHPKKGRFIT